MPITTLSSEQAYQQYKDNPLTNWPERGGPRDRFSPMAAPGFSASTRLIPGEKVFTIGSCFARHVERELDKHGFDIPNSRFTVDEKYWSGAAGTLLNNYVISAVLPQIRWAFGIGEPFSVEKHCVKIGEKYQDLQIAGNVRPQPAEVVAAQRERISAIFRELAEARVVVLTLGLVEAWWDNTAQMYINMAPPKRAVRAEPERFEMHVLDFNDITNSLYELMDLLKEIGHKDLQVVMTVSPVPLTSTFTMQDVALANSYSKSLLRASVDHVRARYDFVGYYPSYESFMLTPKAKAFLKDQVHTNSELVEFNINRMVSTYLGEGEGLSVLDRAEGARKGGNNDLAITILRDALENDSGESDEFVRGALARILTVVGRQEEAREVSFHPDADRDPDALVVRSKFSFADGDYADAEASARKALELRGGFKAARLNLAQALINLDRLDEAEKVTGDLLNSAQMGEWKANSWMLRGLIAKRQGDIEMAEQHFKKALGFQDKAIIKRHLEELREAS